MVDRYTVQPGDTPASIAIAFAGCPKCSCDLVGANPHKPTILYPNGYETFTELQAGEELALPTTWFDGTLDRKPQRYFDELPSVDGRLSGRIRGERASVEPLAGGIRGERAVYAVPLTGGITDFDSLIANVPEASQAWSGVQNQFNAEGGAAAGVIAVAQQNYYDAFHQLTSTLNVLPNSAQGLLQAGSAAAGLVINSSTIGGAVQNVSSLISAVESGAPAVIVQSFTGVLVSGLGLAIAAGAVSFGVGAAIVLGIEVVADVLEGVLGAATPPAATICGYNLTQKPTFIVDCVWTYGQAVTGGPHSPYWRKFPRPAVSGDAWWFAEGPPPVTTWSSGQSSDKWGYAGGLLLGATPTRPIDSAFTVYHQLECDLNAVAAVAALDPAAGGTVQGLFGTPPQNYGPDQVAFARFVRAYMTAWMANQEYALNGLTAQDDGIVLTQLVQFWNAAHETGDTFAIAPRSTASGRGDVVSGGTPCQGGFESEYYYVQMLVGDLGRSNPSALTSGALVINTGLQKNVPLVTAVGSGGAAAVNPPSSTTAVPVVVVGGAAAAAGGVWLYSYLTRQTFQAVVKSVWRRITRL